MANVIYRSFKTRLLTDALPQSLTAATNCYIGLVQGYTENATSHTTITDSGATVHFRGTTALDLTVSGATILSAAVSESPTATGTACDIIVYQQITAADNDRHLICFWDSGATVPVTPNGGSITFTFDGTNGILTL